MIRGIIAVEFIHPLSQERAPEILGMEVLIGTKWWCLVPK